MDCHAETAFDLGEKSSVNLDTHSIRHISMDQDQSLDQDQSEKCRSISQACAQHDVETLVKLATATGGLLTDELRRQACMSLYPFRNSYW